MVIRSRAFSLVVWRLTHVAGDTPAVLFTEVLCANVTTCIALGQLAGFLLHTALTFANNWFCLSSWMYHIPLHTLLHLIALLATIPWYGPDPRFCHVPYGHLMMNRELFQKSSAPALREYNQKLTVFTKGTILRWALLYRTIPSARTVSRFRASHNAFASLLSGLSICCPVSHAARYFPTAGHAFCASRISFSESSGNSRTHHLFQLDLLLGLLFVMMLLV